MFTDGDELKLSVEAQRLRLLGRIDVLEELQLLLEAGALTVEAVGARTEATSPVEAMQNSLLAMRDLAGVIQTITTWAQSSIAEVASEMTLLKSKEQG